MNRGTIRKSAIAGSWYPGDSPTLRRTIQKFLQAAPADDAGGEDLLGMVAPHAGYMYSGQVAACAYQCAAGSLYDSVIVVGPSHRLPFPGASVLPRGGYETPLGVVDVDEELAEAIMTYSPLVKDLPQAHLQEHSIEIQLPFIQVVKPGLPFVPVIMGDQSRDTCVSLAEAIFRASAGKRVLLIGSSDLSHFHDSARAGKMDNIIISHLAAMDPDGLLECLASGSGEACGGGPMAVTMMASKLFGAARGRVLCYADSGDITGDKKSVVGYVAAVFYRE